LPKNDDNEFFYYSIQTKVLKIESNLIELFKLPRILNSLKFLNYLIQTHSSNFINTWKGDVPTHPFKMFVMFLSFFYLLYCKKKKISPFRRTEIQILIETIINTL